MEAVMSEPGTFGQRLRARRIELDLTLAAVAERASLHLQGIAKIEAGTRTDPSWSTVVALCGALGVTPDYFYGVDAAGEQKPNTRKSERVTPNDFREAGL